MNTTTDKSPSRRGHPRMRCVFLLTAACLQLASMQASATMWRCGSTYSDRPCEGGQSIATDDARSTTQQRDAVRLAREAESAADRMERDRLRAEAAASRRQAILIDDKPQPRTAPSDKAPGKLTKKKKNGPNADYFSAHDPVATARNKAEKAAAKKKKKG